jgi:4Fe-4S binding protein/4Fe-4S dicluster protein
MTLTRRLVQLAFLALVLVGVFVYEANCELWCPFGGVEALYTYAAEGNMLCSLGTSNFFILGGVLLSVLLLKRAFCGYMCPIGTISEWLGGLGKRLGLPSWKVPARLDRGLGLLKYVVLVVVLTATWRAGELLFRGYDPCYALLSRHGTDITYWAYVVSGTIAVASLVASVPFCRWFCPFAAVLSPFSRVAFARVRREESACTSCGQCSRRCPMAIPVDAMQQVTDARCTSCLTCVESCPKRADGALSWGPPKPIPGAWSQAALIAVMVLCTSGAVAASYAFPLPSFVKTHGTAPEETASVTLEIYDLTCRGRANLLVYYLERDDLQAIDGYWKLEAWPNPTLAKVRITYDPARCTDDAIRRAITESYYDLTGGLWRHSPFVVEGYDPLDAGLL